MVGRGGSGRRTAGDEGDFAGQVEEGVDGRYFGHGVQWLGQAFDQCSAFLRKADRKIEVESVVTAKQG